MIPIRSAVAIEEKLDLLLRDRNRLRAMQGEAREKALAWTLENYRQHLVQLGRKSGGYTLRVMKGIADRRSNPAQQNLPRIFHPSDTIDNVRRLIWLYLWLLVFEGVFRKRVLPQFSAPLLLIRDPVVLLIYLLALRAPIFPSNIYVVSLTIIAVLSWATGILCSCRTFRFRRLSS